MSKIKKNIKDKYKIWNNKYYIMIVKQIKAMMIFK